MRKIIFYKGDTGRCPVEEYLDSLTNKQVEKIVFVLDLIEQIEIVPHKFFKNLKILTTFGKSGYSRATTYSGYSAFLMEMTLLF